MTPEPADGEHVNQWNTAEVLRAEHTDFKNLFFSQVSCTDMSAVSILGGDGACHGLARPRDESAAHLQAERPWFGPAPEQDHCRYCSAQFGSVKLLMETQLGLTRSGQKCRWKTDQTFNITPGFSFPLTNHMACSSPDDPEGGGAPALCQMVASAANLLM